MSTTLGQNSKKSLFYKLFRQHDFIQEQNSVEEKIKVVTNDHSYDFRAKIKPTRRRFTSQSLSPDKSQMSPILVSAQR